ncbi:putative glucans biosynthesis glucosyltransferase H [Protomyces lactucae-debilis]|uniref:Putative glucans biosynthesis glucosyltransferase H n=1 Tax=Protomyces lactucae-debilis TaxID=2754530 RepID=A0A1Y2FCD4_PROLT|nr:putative glucans biosynthesis glucosyltransferase H [Protomyces lactucae-debilis]ORY80976.1 putative glucans biosynthesis glucosyltransferase H [Protomyces lactucae-debilis]
MQMTNKITKNILKSILPSIKQIPLDDRTQIQVLQSHSDVHSIRRHQFAAFILETGSMLVWSDDASTLVPFAEELEKKMVNLVWKEKRMAKDLLTKDKEKNTLNFTEQELEAGVEPKRGEPYMASICVAMTFAVMAVFYGTEVHEVMLQIKAEGNYMSIGIILYFPLLFFFSSFFAYLICCLILQLIGPISQLNINSKYYSGQAPVLKQHHDLPHITVQCPVYKEDLEQVLAITMQSVGEAIKTYELQGGTASLLVCEDGLQLLSPAEKQRRIAYYKMQGIGWVARPPHGKDGFVRAGKFKKASNLNYTLDVAHRVEAKLEEVNRHDEWSDILEVQEYERCLQEVLQDTPGCEADGNVRVGEFILLIDADTRIPADCFVDAATEFYLSPELAILQHTNDAFQVVNNFWEDCMAHFTRFVTTAMMWSCANGDVAPFVGHNAFLRWSAIQELGWEIDGRNYWWSEEHVSEDFELSLKLQNLGYVVRMASYNNGEFKEGVSLTVYDEINRWQKYSYGISELMWNPLRVWLFKGPFTPLFRQFFLSKQIRGFSKFTMLAYMGTYYAIASWWPLAFINYFILGWYNVKITALYQSAFKILISTLMTFNVFQPVVNAIFRFRTRKGNLFLSLWENFKYITLLCIFFGGLSMFLTVPLLAHLFEIPISWGSTSKTLENSHFLKEMPMIWRRYKWYYLVWITMALAMIIIGTAVPAQWRINDLLTVLPMAWMVACHLLSPLVLNPQSFLSELHI